VFIAGCPPMESSAYRGFADHKDQIERAADQRERHNRESKTFMEKFYDQKKDREDKS
jgi:NADH:ubiquinone oxidoreductase subunit B-like Fe-S oxidoreductase